MAGRKLCSERARTFPSFRARDYAPENGRADPAWRQSRLLRRRAYRGRQSRRGAMSKTLVPSTESKREPLLARLMRWRPVSLSEQAEKLNDGHGVKRDARQPFHQLETLFPNIR